MTSLYLISHTHWDREWYEPFQVFRARLVECIDQVLHLFATDPGYEHFLLDGQTIVLEDYLEVRPDREQILRELVIAGKLDIGPWYVLPDEFLVSGEAIIRNLQRGIRIANDFGGTMRVGYIPDPFGHIGQMPQILRGFGLSTAVFRRGLADEPTEVWWDAPDGSRVLACYLRDSYDNAAWLARDETGFIDGIKRLRDSLAPHAVTPNFLLMHGTDHMMPWQGLTQLLALAQTQLSDSKLFHAALPQYVECVQNEIAQNQIALQIVRGELRNPKRHHLLPGVLSTRMWIKQRNAYAQTLLEKWAEPFGAFANLPNHLIQLAWKYLLQNHPHDSICGCSIDRVHSEMASRFDWVEQIAQPLVSASLNAIALTIDTRASADGIALVVFNPTAPSRTDIVRANIALPGSLEHFALFDEAGNPVPFHIVSRRVEEYYRTEVTGATLGTLLANAQDGRVLNMAIQDAFLHIDHKTICLDVTLVENGEPNLTLIEEGMPQIRASLAQNQNELFDIRAHSPIKCEIEFIAPDVPGLGYKTFRLARPTPPLPLPEREGG